MTNAERSLRGRFTLLGRLRNQWAQASAEPDPARALARLREVRQRLPERPEAAELWPELLRTFLDDRFRPHLTEQDLVDLQVTGEQLSSASGGVMPLEWAWQPLVARRIEAQDTRAACTMLDLLYRSPLTTRPGRIQAAADLAAQGGTEDEHLAVYAEVPVLAGSLPAPVAALVTTLLQVDLRTEPERLARAAKLARLQLQAGSAVLGTARALGVWLLYEGSDLAGARHQLAMAVTADPGDEAAFVPLLAVLIRQGDHVAATAEAGRPGRPTTPFTEQLLLLGRVLSWLDLPGTGGPPPTRAAELATTPMRPYVGPWLDYAVGRLHLVEGDATAAAACLVPLAEQTPRAAWTYHAGWALMLTGDPDRRFPQLFRRLPPTPESWTVAELLLDAHPALRRDGEFQDAVDAATPAYVPVAEARLELVRGRYAPTEPTWRRAAGTLEEDLESLRTVLGHRFALGHTEAMAEGVALGLFRRLPLAEQLLWRGLAALRTDPASGRALLEEAAHRFGHPRATLALAAHDLAQGRTDTAERLHDGPALDAGTRNQRLLEAQVPKAQILRSWAEAHRGADPRAVRDRLGRAALSEPRALHALGLAQLAAGEPGEAARTFRSALAAGGSALRQSTEALARAAETVALGRAAADRARIDAGEDPWVAWTLGLARLADEPETTDLGTCGRLVALAETAANPVAAYSLGIALTVACLRSGDPARAETLVGLLAGLARTAGGRELPILHRKAVAAAARLRWSATDAGDPPHLTAGTAPGNGLLALVMARIALRLGDRDAAGRLVRVVAPTAGDERADCELVAAAVGEDSVAAPATTAAAAATAAAVRTGEVSQRAAVARSLLRAAALVGSDPRRSAELVVEIARTGELAGLVDLTGVLPLLCADGRPPGKATHPLAGLVERLAASRNGGPDPLVLVRSALAIGEVPLAERLWPRALERGGEAPQEYARYLCHQAQQARQAGDLTAASALLRKAEHRFADLLELQVCADRLLARLCAESLGPAAPAGEHRPGRLRVLEQFIQARPALRAALWSGDHDEIGRAWAAHRDDACRDLRVQHALAVALWESAAEQGDGWLPTVLTGFLWNLLLSAEEFWAEHRDPAVQGTLRQQVARDLLGRSATAGARAMSSGDDAAADIARNILTYLNTCRLGRWTAMQDVLRLSDLPGPERVDQGRLAEIQAVAEEVLDKWCLDVLEAARKRVEDPDAIDRLPEGIDKDYAAGLDRLRQVVRADLAEPGPGISQVLRTGLGWCNDWSYRLYNRRELDEIRAVIEKAEPYAVQLARVATKGGGHRPENQLLSRHLMYSGYVAQDFDREVSDLIRALEWNPANTNAVELLAGAHLRRARELADQGKYAAATEMCEVARELAPTTPEIDDAVERLWEEMSMLAVEEPNIARLDAAKQAAKANDHATALAEARKIPADSRFAGIAKNFEASVYFMRGLDVANSAIETRTTVYGRYQAGRTSPFTEAVQDIRTAIKTTEDADDRKHFTEQLARVLNSEAVFLVQWASSLTPQSAVRRLLIETARGRLVETVRLDPSFTAGRENLNAIS